MGEGRQYPTKEHWSRTPGNIHWATALVARDHRDADLGRYGMWLCPCRSCTDVRRSMRLHEVGAAQ